MPSVRQIGLAAQQESHKRPIVYRPGEFHLADIFFRYNSKDMEYNSDPYLMHYNEDVII